MRPRYLSDPVDCQFGHNREIPEILWSPSEEVIANANVTKFMRWLSEFKDLNFPKYEDLWEWSVTDLEGFWSCVWDYFEIIERQPYTQVLGPRSMPDVEWFAGAQLNYAEHALRRMDDHVAIVSQSEVRPRSEMTYRELHQHVAQFAEGLRKLGVGKGDRVAAILPNVWEAVVAFLATASVGAIWSACSPEFGTRSVIDRLVQIEPKLLLAVDGYRYGGKDFNKLGDVRQIQNSLPTLRQTVVLSYLRDDVILDGLANAMHWSDVPVAGSTITFEPVSFDHPLWILYSSGTTGLPKPIVHGHGGIVIEHLKTITFHMDLTEQDRFFWFTTTGWMMWNFLVGGLLVGCTINLYDGSPGEPNMNVLWEIAANDGVTYFGTSAPYIQGCMKQDVHPSQEYDLSRIRGVGSTGAPLTSEGFDWVYENINSNLLLGSFSGGTDVCTGFVGPIPLLPVRSGEIQASCLGAKVEAFDPRGLSLVGEVGELVLTQPLPSMPLYFWNDPDHRRLHESYFDMFPGIWRHGDWVEFTERGSCVISGRSDSTLNRGGVRIGTSDFYRVVEECDYVVDSLVVDTGSIDNEGSILLFVVLKAGLNLSSELVSELRLKLRTDLSPRHVPDEVHQVLSVPRTLNGKKLEVPIKRILSGTPVEQAISKDAMADPRVLDPFVERAAS